MTHLAHFGENVLLVTVCANTHTTAAVHKQQKGDVEKHIFPLI